MDKLENPHEYGKSLTIPYNYLNNDAKRLIYKSVNTIIVPKLQEILRKGKEQDNSNFLKQVFYLIKRFREQYNFVNIQEFIDNYLVTIEEKYQMHQKLADILSIGINEKNRDNVDILIKKNIEIEIFFFAYSSLVKEYAQKLVNYFLTIDESLENTINAVSSGSFYKEFASSYNKYKAGLYDKKQFVADFFNDEDIFLEEFMKTYNGSSGMIQEGCKQNKKISIPDNPLFEKLISLLTIDNIIDKYIEFKKFFLHDILIIYKQKFGDMNNISEQALQETIEFLFNKVDTPDLDEEQYKSYPGIISIKDIILYKGVYGNKAYNLGILENNGIQVPRGLVLSNEFLQKYIRGEIDQNEINSLTEHIKQKVGERLAIRSSFLGEDNSNKSYAGHFESYINKDVLESNTYIRKVIDSGNKNTEEGILPGVLIQEFIKGEYSGVTFIQGGEMIIEMVKGLNADLVGGKKTPYTFKVKGENKEIPGNNTISEEILSESIKSFEKVYKIFNKANIDIEFTIKNGKLYILQVRPITAKVYIERSNIKNNINIALPAINIVSAGDFNNRLLIIKNPKDIEKIDKNCIILTDKLYTDLIFKTNFIQGILSEEGGYLAHLSIVCREMGIPLLCNTFGIIDHIQNTSFENIQFNNNTLLFS